MKKSLVTIGLIVASMFFSSNVFAGWGTQQSQWVAPGQELVVYFIPALPGDREHSISFSHYYKDSAGDTIWSEGRVKMYWAEYPNVSALTLFAYHGVTTRVEYEELPTWSEDIFFKIVFKNDHDESIQFVWNFFTDD